MNFAPYQSSPPESTRALSPPPRATTTSPRASLDNNNNNSTSRPKPPVSHSSVADPWAASRAPRLPSPGSFARSYQDAPEDGDDRGYDDLEGGRGRAGTGALFTGRGLGEGGAGGGGVGDVFETSLGFRMDVEACLAYVLLPPAGGVALLVFEKKSDYVRFHAWQSSLVFTAAFVLHLLFSWTSVISWLLFVGDMALIAYLAYHAYRDAETLDRCELPFFGRIASNFVDSE